ncbi:hypothetical protein [Dyella sp. C9]|uniref:hypothetical protein n=1 Tax=Dyella sp. C9 TaxID=2202154 RepID=UPI0031B6CD05
MAYKSSRRVDALALLRALPSAMQWRLLLLWALMLLLPVIVVAVPLLQSLGELLDHSVHARGWARQFDLLMMTDVGQVLGREHALLHGAATASLLCALLSLPLLHGMVVASGRSGRTLGFGALLQGGLVEYGRMFRLQLWALLPYAAAGYLLQVGLDHAADRADLAVLESQAMAAQHLAWCFGGLVMLVALLWVESARAAFIADGGLRSATLAMGRGLMQVLRRPFSSLLVFVLVSLPGLAIALGLGLVRAHTLAVGRHGLLLAFVLTQLVVASLGWMRIARLYALTEIARSLGGSRRAGLL